MANQICLDDAGHTTMYAENKTCAFFTIELYSTTWNEVLRSVERGIVFENSEPSWEQLHRITEEFLDHDDIEEYEEVEEIIVRSTGKYWVTAENVNGDTIIVRIKRPPIPDSPSRAAAAAADEGAEG